MIPVPVIPPPCFCRNLSLYYVFFVILPLLAGHVTYTVLTFVFMFLSHLAVTCLSLGGPDSLGFVCSGLEAGSKWGCPP